MMSHQAFLSALCQMGSYQKARIVVEGHSIFIEEAKEGWVFSTEVFSVEGRLPAGIAACVSPSGRIHAQLTGFDLKFDASCCGIVLSSQVGFQKGKYLPFRDHLIAFISAAHEWQATFQLLAQQDGAYQSFQQVISSS